MGEVWKARDIKLGRDVALKILPAAFASNPDRMARFEREARVLASLDHPNIAAIHGVVEDRALVMGSRRRDTNEFRKSSLSMQNFVSDRKSRAGSQSDPETPQFGPEGAAKPQAVGTVQPGSLSLAAFDN
jgi:serine/threonine protein kinase